MPKSFSAAQKALAAKIADLLLELVAGATDTPDTPEPESAKVTKAVTRGRATKAAAAPEPDPEPDDDDDDDEEEDEAAERAAELADTKLADLRKLARELDVEDAKTLPKDDLIDAILAEEFGDPDDDESDSDDDADDGANDERDAEVEKIQGMSLQAARKYVLNDYDVDDADVAAIKKADKDALIAFIFPDDDDESDSDDDADEDEDEDDEDGITEEELREMSIGDLKKVAGEFGVVLKPRQSRESIVKAIVDMSEVPSDEG